MRKTFILIALYLCATNHVYAVGLVRETVRNYLLTQEITYPNISQTVQYKIKQIMKIDTNDLHINTKRYFNNNDGLELEILGIIRQNEKSFYLYISNSSDDTSYKVCFSVY